MKKQIENCQFFNWYPKLRSLSPRAIVLEAPEDFRQYLLADGIYLHESASENSDEGLADADADSIESDSVVKPPESFHKAIEEAITKLGGAVAPKLNWSAPRDACWINATNDMKCITANDIYTLMKSSDYVTHDLTHAYGKNRGPENITLVLREWFELNPALEFRCFVREHALVGITQRDMNFYEFMPPLKKQFEKLLVEGCQEVITRFPDSSFVADFYIPKSQRHAWLIDINPWLERTDSLLFDWNELKDWNGPFDFRIVEREDAIRGFSSRAHSTNHVPHDFVDMQTSEFSDLLETVRDTRRKQLSQDF